MSYLPKVIVIDYETPGLEYYRKDFYVESCAFAWRGKDGEIKTKYLTDHVKILDFLKIIEREKIECVAHNVQFEMGVTKCVFPEVSLNWKWDTLRLCQNKDGGGEEYDFDKQPKTLEELLTNEEEEDTYRTGLSLVACASRFLPREYHNHKDPYFKWLRDNGYRDPGANLIHLPPKMLEEYNTADVVIELLLYEIVLNDLLKEGHNPEFDHMLYLHRCDRMSDAKISGVRVNRPWLGFRVHTYNEKTLSIQTSFLEWGKASIQQFEDDRMWNYIQTGKASGNGSYPKSKNPDKTFANRFEKLAKYPELYRFNINSTTQLAKFFIDYLGMRPKFMTATGEKKRKEWGGTVMELMLKYPSFSAAHLPSWGPGGEILQGLKKLAIVKKQMENLFYLSEYDGRWHLDIKSAGTKTNRLSGGSDYA